MGTDLYKNASTTILLNVPITDTSCKNVVATKYDEAVYFSGNVFANYTQYTKYGVDDIGEVTEGNVTVFVDGEKLGICDLDVNGNFVYIWKTTRNLIGETINFTGFYKDNRNHFNPSNFSKSFTFTSKMNTTIISTVNRIDEDTVLVSGHVDDENGSAVLGGTIAVNGNYSVVVDTNGNFKFYLANKTTYKPKYELGVIYWGSSADITVNEPLMNGIEHTALVDQIIDLCKLGSPYIKFGNGNGKTVIVNSGTHGGELPPQIAAFKLIDLLANYGDEINGTIYVFPVLFPEATANNVRIFNGTNLNTVAAENGSISNSLVKFSISLNASGLGDFHSTRHADSDVGITCIMGSISPTNESSMIAHFVSNETGYYCDIYPQAGVPYAGAIEDYSNILGGPAITAESLCNHKAVEYGTPEITFSSMRAFLRYFGFDIDEMVTIPITDNNISLTFASPYNYISSHENINLNTQIVAKNASYTINYDGKYSITLKDSNGTVIEGKKITFTLAGKNIGVATTNSKGIATIKLTAKILKTAKSGKKNLVVKFSDDNYEPATKTVKITINKEKTKLTANAKSFKSTLKTKKYTVILKDSKNKVMKKAKVTLKVNGKTYKATTNSKGKATFKITKLTKKGTVKATVKYAGNDYYKSASKTVKLTIK